MNKVVILKVDSYKINLLKEVILDAFNYLGGLEELIPHESKVLLKPNLLSAHLPEECVNTNPNFIRAVIEVLRLRTSKIMIGDSPGGCSGYQEVLEKSGLKRLARETGIKIVGFEKCRIIDGIPIAEEVLESDLVISLPKFKTHPLTLITAGVKNCFGCVPGLYKSELHRRYPKATQLSQILIKIYQIVRPKITIMDAIWAMEGDGPSAGDPRKVGLILASMDAVSLDAISAYLIGVTPLDIPTNRIAHDMGIGETDLNKIEIISKHKLDNLRINDFKLPGISLLDRLPQPLFRFGSRLIKFFPEVIIEKCIKCEICVESCPVNAMSLYSKAVIINHKKCILCLCCYEVCPENAIEIKRSYLAKKLGI